MGSPTCLPSLHCSVPALPHATNNADHPVQPGWMVEVRGKFGKVVLRYQRSLEGFPGHHVPAEAGLI